MSYFCRSGVVRPFYRVSPNISSIPHAIDNLIRAEDWHDLLKKNKMLSFSFVRHPFERLVSSYKDKVLGKDGDFFRKTYPIVYKSWYKNNHSFPSFVDLILNKYKSIKISNIHWNPISDACKYCDIEYDVIGRMETFSDDVRYIIKKNHLEKDLPSSMAAVSENAAKLKTSKVTAEYFSQLSNDQIKDLHELYRMDFELFDYDALTYFNTNALIKQ